MATFRLPFLLLLLPAVLLHSCDSPLPGESPKKELLIYCGTTMSAPVLEIAKRIEARENCIVKISQGGSGNLYLSLTTNKKGDLFLPGSESYMQTAIEQGLISDTVPVGYNYAAFLVPKGNPKGITSKLSNLLNPDHRIALGLEESGSIGRETKRMLDRRGLSKQAYDRAIFLTSDSRGLSKAIRENKADLVLNWYPCSLLEGNKAYMDAIELDRKDAPPHRLVVGLLQTSYYPDIARRFMELAASEEGQAIFAKYGFGEKE
jgi:molybdate transport system substrate-binding protein